MTHLALEARLELRDLVLQRLNTLVAFAGTRFNFFHPSLRNFKRARQLARGGHSRVARSAQRLELKQAEREREKCASCGEKQRAGVGETSERKSLRFRSLALKRTSR